MSDALVWHLIRDNNCFLQKRGRTSRSGGVQFSSEAGNLLNVNTYKYSGIANSNTIDIQTGSVIKRRDGQKNQKPRTAIRAIKAKAFKADKVYRRDLAVTAAIRLNKVAAADKVKGGCAKGASVIKSGKGRSQKRMQVGKTVKAVEA